MLQENEFILETTDRKVADEILSARLDGVAQNLLFHKAFVDPEPVIRFVISAASDVSIGLFSAWLYDLVKKRGADKTSIQGQKVPENATQIALMVQVTIENNEAQAGKQREQISEFMSKHGTDPQDG